ncbi:MAG: DUF4175 domain-containing protein [Hyphomonas sp.]|uniref:DUF4175 domain-containing protein n=1 Tax=Hyphomonas sp. TaxID=87 RepID=UPI001855BFCF|nr:DUF4175 family protein [Hyphomonas sp.]MBU3920626.1 DUF4175 domain-containing protein [Alphaproteobacteria bacterium]MBA3068990.1 DUF4175 domain-containing protein [Hyphomonas sp.]MBU4061623.1 DUF4175 domain-containing protein [Alphaproteobacteria bacterium]MBU4163468.1 DUF4175 domain-containing protein [Alphaproteobacteria bacterium]MBU4569207.1 DUF4175 domain-containing protein [Alphaproteobacteria bacterium]
MAYDGGLTQIAAKVAATQRRLTRLALGRAFWPVFVLVMLYLAAALSGGFDRLDKITAALITPVLLAGAGLLIWQGRRRYVPPDEAEASQLLEAPSELRPLSSLKDRPAYPSAEAAGLWSAHRERLLAELKTLRLPRFSAEWKALDPYFLRAILPVAVIAFAVLAGGDGPGRVWRALFPDYGALVGADKMIVEAWVTPPEHTGRPPIFLKPGSEDVRVPRGSEVTLRTEAPSAPRLVMKGARDKAAKFMATPDGAWEAKATITGDTRLSVRWWGERASYSFTVLPDAIPAIQFVGLPEPGAQDRVKFAWKARDDYGVVGVDLAIRLREPHPAAPDAEERVPVPMPGAAGAKEANASLELDLTRHPWAGLAVDLQLVALDGSGQEGRSESVPYVLPEKLLLDPLARAAQEARVTVLREPREYAPPEKNPAALTGEALNLAATGRLDAAPEGVRQAAAMLGAVTYKGEMFFDDLGVFMGFKMAETTLVAANSKAEADAVDSLLWAIALKLEFGSAADAARRLEAARAALERALRDGAPEEEIRRLMEAFRDAANEYLAAKMAEAIANGLDAPPPSEDGEAQAGGQGLGGQDFEDMLNALQDLTETGASDQARQLLSDITNMLENLEFQQGGQGQDGQGMPGQQAEGEESELPPEEQELTDAMRRLSELLREQRQLNDDTLAQQRGEQPSGQGGTPPPFGSPDGEGAEEGAGGQQEGSGMGQGETPGETGTGAGEDGEPQDGDQGGGREPGGTLAERQAELGRLVEEFARRSGEGEADGAGGSGANIDPDALSAIRDAQRRAEQALENGNEGRAAVEQERATQMMSEMSRGLASALDSLQAERLGEQGGGEDPMGRALMGAGNDGENVNIPEKAERQRAKDILDELRRRYNEAEDEEEKEYLRRLLDRF